LIAIGHFAQFIHHYQKGVFFFSPFFLL